MLPNGNLALNNVVIVPLFEFESGWQRISPECSFLQVIEERPPPGRGIRAGDL